MYKLVLIRHGESTWNKENRFTGWIDVDLSPRGIQEAGQAAELLKKEGLVFDNAYVSVLLRAIKTLNIVLEGMGLHWIPVKKNWRLNERHYGALQGLNKTATAKKHGDAQVKIWRRSYDIPPPALEKKDERHPCHEPRYANLKETELPATECLKDTVDRFLPLWHNDIAPAITRGQRILIAAHGNSLRALVKYLDNMSDEDVLQLNIPTGAPLVYELDKDLQPLKRYYLGNQKAIKSAMDAVANQGSKN